jgi:hypothetical protein
VDAPPPPPAPRQAQPPPPTPTTQMDGTQATTPFHPGAFVVDDWSDTLFTKGETTYNKIVGFAKGGKGGDTKYQVTLPIVCTWIQEGKRGGEGAPVEGLLGAVTQGAGNKYKPLLGAPRGGGGVELGVSRVPGTIQLDRNWGAGVDGGGNAGVGGGDGEEEG